MNENRQPWGMEQTNVGAQPALNHRSSLADEAEIDLVEIFYVILGHLWQAMLCLIVGGALTFAFTFYFIDPTYKATAKIYMVSASENSQINLSDLNTGSSLAKDYIEMMKIRPIMEDVIRNLELDVSIEGLSKQIAISSISDSRLLRIEVTDTNPFLAADIANEVANQAVVYLPLFMESKAPTIAETAQVPTKKAGPNITRNTALGAIAGFVLYSGILVLLYLLDDTMKTPEDVEKYLGIRPLATIPEGDLGSFALGERGDHGEKRRKKRKTTKTARKRSEG